MDIENKTEESLIQEGIENLKKLVDSPELLEQIIEFRKEEENPGDEFQTSKLIDCAHEIVFTITAEALSQNEKGEITGSKDICVKNFHIPVPIDKDYNHYMHVFFDYLEKKIIDSIDNANTNSKDNKEFKDE